MEHVNLRTAHRCLHIIVLNCPTHTKEHRNSSDNLLIFHVNFQTNIRAQIPSHERERANLD